ncbi:MAG: FAD-dependent oxidoreductase [Deltaproteobacteria bacterium]|nr:FAD-dependent oxidoreductase [Deltaproteobacteria bacterium]
MLRNGNKTGRIHFNRRSFLKVAAATGVMATIATEVPSAIAQSSSEKNIASKTWRDKPDPIDESLISDGGTYDVVIVGGGISGAFCARTAALNGASVAVIEHQAEKSYTWIGTEVGTVNSQHAQDHGAPRIAEDDFIRELARRNVIRHNPKRASYFAKNSGKIFDWVIKELDKAWLAENSHVMSCPPPSTRITEVSGWKFYHGSTVFRKMTDDNGTFRFPEVVKTHYEKAKADGARWFFEHHSEICDIDSSGAVTGVVAKRAEGKYVRFKARKAVALCAGDFSANREMVIDLLDQLRHEAEAKGDLNVIVTNSSKPLPRDGSGIKMGIWAGGHVEIGPHAGMNAGDPGTGGWHLQLDSNGERFCDEAAGAMFNNPKESFTVTIHDANWKKVLEMMPPRHMAPDTAHTINWPRQLTRLDNIKPGPPSQNTQEGSGKGGPMGGNVYCANTVEELLDYMDCYKGESKKRALASIVRYKELCEKGADEDFGKDPRILKATALKDPPFYGTISKSRGGSAISTGNLSPGLVSVTGLDADADGHVLDSQFKPIKGLYAAGNNAGGRFITVYQSPLAGMSLGMAMTEGFMLGERLALL